MRSWVVAFIAGAPMAGMLAHQYDATDWEGWAFLACIAWLVIVIDVFDETKP